MPVAVPAPYHGWVNTASAHTGIPANVVAAQISQESGFNPRATSPTGAQGIAQFEPGTWKSQGVAGSPYDPNAALQGYIKLMGSLTHQYGGNLRNALAAYNAGPGNLQAGYGYADTILKNAGHGPGGALPQVPGGSYTTGGQTTATNVPTPSLSLTEPTFDQAGYNQALAKYKAGSFLASQSKSSNPYADKGPSLGPNPLFGAGLLTTQAPNAANYQGTKQVKLAQNQVQILSKSPLVVHPGAAPPGNYKGYVNPVQGFTLGRTDQGIDANAPAGTPIKAIGDSQLVDVQSNWYAGQPLLLFKFLNGPKAGQYWYVAEQINPTTIRKGMVFHAGETVATYAHQGTGLEIGFGHPGGGDTLAQAQGNTGGPGHSNAPAGVDFRNFIGQLGAK